MAKKGVFPSFYTLLLSLECLLLWRGFFLVAGYSTTVVQSSIVCNRTTVTFSLDPDSYLIKQLFQNCIPVTPIECGSFGKIYVKREDGIYTNESEIYSEDEQDPSLYPITVDFHKFNLTAQSIGGNDYEVAEMIQVPLVAIPYAPNHTIDFVPGGKQQLWNSSFPFFVNCLWTSEVRDNSSVGVPPGGNGDGQTGTISADKAVNMTVAPRDGGGSGIVQQGDVIRVTLNLVDTVHFAAELPRRCTIGILSSELFSPISDSCPNLPLESAATALGIHSTKVNNQSYHFDFNAFTVDGQSTNLTISCWIQICVDPAACQKACWDASHRASTRNFGRFNEKTELTVQAIIPSSHRSIIVLPRESNMGPKISISLWLLSLCLFKTIQHYYRI